MHAYYSRVAIVPPQQCVGSGNRSRRRRGDRHTFDYIDRPRRTRHYCRKERWRHQLASTHKWRSAHLAAQTATVRVEQLPSHSLLEKRTRLSSLPQALSPSAVTSSASGQRTFSSGLAQLGWQRLRTASAHAGSSRRAQRRPPTAREREPAKNNDRVVGPGPDPRSRTLLAPPEDQRGPNRRRRRHHQQRPQRPTGAGTHATTDDAGPRGTAVLDLPERVVTGGPRLWHVKLGMRPCYHLSRRRVVCDAVNETWKTVSTPLLPERPKTSQLDYSPYAPIL
ncbi:hypothetical protein HPB51_007119 [Rhipicephalus microplus]|uniref:Uncharacterized protein n=1 Tax=Rhipicephalus microplus TaxID=6941 RepID=A0A9J6E0C7_RHIMP|nr:hypothetical protein HPB51_007119 [Rhipicephalus microplus]